MSTKPGRTAPESPTTLSDGPPLTQAEAPAAPIESDLCGEARGAPVQVVVGPVGAGKSTFALGLARRHGAVRFSLDEWMTRLFSPDRPEDGVVEWYLERAARCIDQIWSVVTRLVETGTAVILEIGLLTRAERALFYRRAAEAGLELTVHVLDAPREVRRERVMERNRARGPTFSMVVPPHVFELASDRWEPPDAEECAGRDVRFVFVAASSGRTEGAR